MTHVITLAAWWKFPATEGYRIDLDALQYPRVL
jgi:hypothetical protein